jgi:hypothetical protein
MPYLFSTVSYLIQFKEQWGTDAALARDGNHPWLLDNFMDRIILAPPPSYEHGEEIGYLTQLAAFRALVGEVEIQHQNNEFLTYFARDAEFDWDGLPKTYFLAMSLMGFSVYPIMKFKAFFNRARPYEIAPIAPSFKVQHPAYPSGHSTQAHLIAFFLSELFPKKREFFLTTAARIAFNRELAGVHYPSDSRAGTHLAREIYQLLPEVDAFRKMLAEVKTEISTP